MSGVVKRRRKPSLSRQLEAAELELTRLAYWLTRLEYEQTRAALLLDQRRKVDYVT